MPVIAQTHAAGAMVTDGPRDWVWDGDAGYFQDRNGYLWEVVWNPWMPISEDEADIVVSVGSQPSNQSISSRTSPPTAWWVPAGRAARPA